MVQRLLYERIVLDVSDRAKKEPPENVGPRGAKDSDVFPGAIGRFAAVVADSFPHVMEAAWQAGEAVDRHPCQSSRFVVRSNLQNSQVPVQTRPQGSKLSVVLGLQIRGAQVGGRIGKWIGRSKGSFAIESLKCSSHASSHVCQRVCQRSCRLERRLDRCITKL
jgi:hypothetical protein